MADVNIYLADILDAVYGEEVRQAIHDAISAMNDQVNSLASELNEVKKKADNAILDSNV